MSQGRARATALCPQPASAPLSHASTRSEGVKKMRTWRVESGRSTVTLVVSLLLLLSQAASGWQQAASSGGTLPTDSPAEFEVVSDKPVRFDIALKPGELFRV